MPTRRQLLLGATAAGFATRSAGVGAISSEAAGAPRPGDRVFICNEDSNTLAVIDPVANRLEATVNLTSFDEDHRPPFRLVTGGMTPSHAAMIQKPLYRGAIAIHGAAPSPDNQLLAMTGRGTSNVYLVDTATLRVIGGRPNPLAGATTNAEQLSGGILVGREPHEPTFTRDGAELWVAVRGDRRLAIIDVARATSPDTGTRATAVTGFVDTIDGPAQIGFALNGALAFVCSQKRAVLDILDRRPGAPPRRKLALDLSDIDPFGFTPFLKTTPDGAELWLSHKLADRVSCVEAAGRHRVTDIVELGRGARPNHVEFVENASGRSVYVSLARIDDGGPGGAPASRLAIIDRSAPPGARQLVGMTFTGAREAHGLWTDPSNTRLYVAHEQDELPGTMHAGETVCAVFDVTDVFAPRLLARIPLGHLQLPSGRLRNKKSINLVYVRRGARSQAG